MATITVGTTSGTTNLGISTLTFVVSGYPCSGNGIIDTIKVQCINGNFTDFKIAAFSGTRPTFTSKDSALIGAVNSGSEQTFTGLSLDILLGEFIGGYYGSSGRICTGSGNGISYNSGDCITGIAVTYANSGTTGAFHLYGSGTETAVGGFIPQVMIF